MPLIAATLLIGVAGPASADPTAEWSQSIDRAGNAVNRQLRSLMGEPERPADRPTRRRATTQRTPQAVKPANAQVPLPPERPDEPDTQAVAAEPEKPAAPDKAPLPAAKPAENAAAVPDPGAAPAPATKPQEQAAVPSEAKASEAKPDTPAPPDERSAAEEPTATAVPLPTPAPDRLAALPPPAAGPAVEPPKTAQSEPIPTICPELSNDDLGVFKPTEVKTTETACTLDRGVTLTAVRMKDGRLVELQPAAELRCEMAASVARWLREKVEPAVAMLGSPLDKVLVAGSLQCRPRNHVAGAKISEHGRGNALDTRGYVLKDGRRFVIGPPSKGTSEVAMPLAFQERLKASACADFTTILGPGSDGYHEQHLHVDRAERRSGAVLCQWATARVEPAAPKPPAKPAEAKPEAPAASDAAPETDTDHAPDPDAAPGSTGKSQ